jgi:hypothetical protein
MSFYEQQWDQFHTLLYFTQERQQFIRQFNDNIVVMYIRMCFVSKFPVVTIIFSLHNVQKLNEECGVC